MDLRCISCNTHYDRSYHIPHFLPCGCDICGACVSKFVYRTAPGAPPSSNNTSRPTTPTVMSRRDSQSHSHNNQQQPQQMSSMSSSSVASALTSPVVPVVVTQPYKCPRGHLTSAATINNCQPMIAHRLAEQVRDVTQTCSLHQRRPLDFWCVPCRKALCGVCAVSHKEESSCLLPARPIQQCTGEILKMAYECKGQLENSTRAVQNCQVVTNRLLKTGTQVPIDLMNQCLVAVEQFQQRLLKSVDGIWREHMLELRNVKRAHQALTDVDKLLDNYKDKMQKGERLCDETDAATRTVDPLPLASTMAQIENDQVLGFPLKLYSLRGIESVNLDPSGTTLSASWQEPFHGKGEFVPFAGVGTSQGVAAAAMLDRASSPQTQRRFGSTARTARSQQSASLPRNAQVNIDGTPVKINDQQESYTSAARGHTPLGLLSVTDILNMGPNRKSLTDSNNGPILSAERQQPQSTSSTKRISPIDGSRSSTPLNRSSRRNQTPPREPYVQVRNFNPMMNSSNNHNSPSASRRR